MAVEAASGAHRPAGRPTQKVLSKERITAAALKLIEAGGYERLTMSALAKSLQVAPSALYNHVASKQDVLVLVQDDIITSIDVSAFGTEPWEAAIRRWAWSYRDVFTRHTPLIPVIAVLPVTGAGQTLRMYETLTAAFLDDGWPEPLIVPAIVALESFIFGSAFDVTAPEDIFESGELAEANPKFTSAVRSQDLGTGGSAADAAFRLGLEGLIGGLQAQRDTWAAR
ncbi:helix-turn-helix domain-containing protein [Arthrobacter crystallopoietes]|uniref:TetR/AcrR family transcriptional regulator n=1 Tax=Micrococcaceae TaxID=1268 RepID=UPI0021CABD3F|nr:TetR/AcrR family transcriptional regulator [Arthrobacter sp. Marseille-P9274]